MKGTGIQGAAQSAHAGAKRAADSNWVDGLARFGLSAKGISYALIGILAGALAFGLGGQATSRQGALEVLADESLGKVLLVALVLGFTAYGLWRLVQAIFDRDDEGSGARGIVKRVGYLGRAVLYGVLTWTTLRLLSGSGGEGDSQTGEARNATSTVLDWPAGRWLVGVGGLILIGVGIFNGYRALTQKFEEN